MTTRRAVYPCIALSLALIGSPAAAGQHWRIADAGHWRSTHQAIYELENRIALLEANPQTDDGYRGPIIERARAEILRLRATLRPPQWRWQTPCCYSRRPIHIR